MNALVALALVGTALSQDEETIDDIRDIEDVSLADLLNIETDVASHTALSLRESPGILTVVTRDEIVRSGARDLLDILDKLVPGFQFAADTWGFVGAGFRGNWAAEGKYALIVDGIEYNEVNYGTVAQGNHFSSENIQRVEVIRGPGSAKYGGSAELAVIRVTTLAGDGQWTGLETWGRYSVFEDLVYGRRELGATWAGYLGTSRLAVDLRAGQGHRSSDDYTDFWGNTYDMAEASALDPMHGAVHFGAGGLDVHVGFDRFIQTHRDNYTRIAQTVRHSDFSTYFGRATYKVDLSDSVTLTPMLHFRRAYPWHSTSNVVPASFNYVNDAADRGGASVELSVAASEAVDVHIGVQTLVDQGVVSTEQFDIGEANLNGERSVTYHQVGAYAETIARIPDILNVTAGGRVDHHGLFGPSFAPRLGLTRAEDRYHAKILASRGYRTPVIENLNSTPDLLPEYVWVFEAELGAGIGDQFYATLNAYDATIYQGFLYFYTYDPETDEELEGYRNGKKTGTWGGELAVKADLEPVRINGGYTYYNTASKNEVAQYRVQGQPASLLAFANHKGHVDLSVDAGDLSITPGVTIVGPRWVYASDGGGAREREVTQLPTAALLDLSLYYRDLGADGLDLGLSAHDLLDATPGYPQPYDGFHAVIPDPGREIMLELHFAR